MLGRCVCVEPGPHRNPGGLGRLGGNGEGVLKSGTPDHIGQRAKEPNPGRLGMLREMCQGISVCREMELLGKFIAA